MVSKNNKLWAANKQASALQNLLQADPWLCCPPLGCLGSLSPSLPLPASFTLPDGIYSSFPLPRPLPADSQGGMTWAAQGGGDSELLAVPRTVPGHLFGCGRWAGSRRQRAHAGDAHQGCSPGMLTRKACQGATSEVGRKGRGILHPPRGTGEQAEGTRVPAGAGRGAERDT